VKERLVRRTGILGAMNFYTPWMIDYRVVSDASGGTGHGDLLGFLLPSTTTAGATA
jgi:hypothetical protein